MPGMQTDIPVAVSYSGGGSSGWMLTQLFQEKLPRPRHLIVLWVRMPEHEWTFEEVEHMRGMCARYGVDFIECRPPMGLDEHLLQLKTRDDVTRLDQPPFFIAKGFGVGRAEHRCTRVFKVATMRRVQSAWLQANGLPKRIVKWIGFGSDEAHRAVKAVARQQQDVKWETLDFPAIRLGKTRAQMRLEYEAFMRKPSPRFSMCWLCPFKGPERWTQTTPKDLTSAYEVDEAIRDLDCIGLTEGPAYLTNRLIPIRRLIKNGDPQPNLPGLDSYCDGGACFL